VQQSVNREMFIVLCCLSSVEPTTLGASLLAVAVILWKTLSGRLPNNGPALHLLLIKSQRKVWGILSFSSILMFPY
jgi:hypothetical protein